MLFEETPETAVETLMEIILIFWCFEKTAFSGEEKGRIFTT